MRIGLSLPSRLGDGAPGGGLTQREIVALAVLADSVRLLPLVSDR